MLVLRLLLFLGLISIVVTLAVYLFTGDRRYLRFTWQVIKFALMLVLVVAGVITMSRIILL